MDYITNELLIGLPNDSPQDMSLNMLWFKERGTNLVIARGDLEANNTLEGTYKNQLKKLSQQVKVLKCTDPKEAVAGTAKDIKGYEITTDFIRGPEHSYQYQFVCQIPNTQRMLAITYSKTSPLTEQDITHWQEIKDNLQFS